MAIYFSRDSIVWTLGLITALCAYIAADNAPEHVKWAHYAQDLSVLIGVISGYMKASPLPSDYHLWIRRNVTKRI